MKLEIKAKNYTPKSISFMQGFFVDKHGDFVMYVDQDKADLIIEKLLAEGREIESAELGLDGDFSNNSTTVFFDMCFFNYDAHEGSRWAEPTLIVHYKDGSNEAYSCWFQKIEMTTDVVSSSVIIEVKQIERK